MPWKIVKVRSRSELCACCLKNLPGDDLTQKKFVLSHVEWEAKGESIVASLLEKFASVDAPEEIGLSL